MNTKEKKGVDEADAYMQQARLHQEPAKRGPKPLHGENMQAFHFRMTKAQREKLEALGGAAWIRGQIDKAKTPT